MNSDKFKLPSKIRGCATNVWIEFSDLARKYKPLNLGQGAPDFIAPKLLTTALEAVSKSTDYTLHQYTRGFGHPRLVNAISKLFSPLINHELVASNEIIITNGATEALYNAVFGFIEDGDEVIIIEPYFDCYEYLVRMAGGTARFIPLRLKDDRWVLNMFELEELFNVKTKMIIVNTPHNPTGKVFTRDELEIIAEFCMKWDVLCVSDEVYEWMVYKPNQHVRIATLPGMWERTITIGSGGKTFSATGWKTGWAYGPANLIFHLQVIHQNCVYCCGTPLQEALALAFEKEIDVFGKTDSFFVSLTRSLAEKRDFVAKFLQEAGFKPILPEGGYFMLADWSELESKVNLQTESDQYRDFRFAKWMIKNIGLQVIPASTFYSEANKHLGEQFIRLCFIKEDENLQKGADILKNWH